MMKICKRLISIVAITIVICSIFFTNFAFKNNIYSLANSTIIHEAELVETEIDLKALYDADHSRITASTDLSNAPNVVDGDPSTGWDPSVIGSWWMMDLGSLYNVSKSQNTTLTTGFAYYYSSNGADWTGGILAGQTFDPTVSVRYIRFVSIAPQGIPHIELREARLWQKSDIPPTPSPSPSPSSSGSSTPTTTPTQSQTSTSTPTPTTINGIEIPYDPTKPAMKQDDKLNLALTVPNGGEKWKLGKTYQIKWSFTDNEQKFSKFGLFLSTDEGKSYKFLIKNNLDKINNFDWTISDDEKLITDKARVLIAAVDSNNQVLINDASDQNFEIKGEKLGMLGTENTSFPLTWISVLLLLLGGGAVFWPLILNSLLNSSAADLLNRLFLLTAPGMGNKKATGVVYDSYTKTPISRAMVRIFNAENNKQLESIITNNKGEFSFIIPNGTYYLKVNSTQYNFPSQRLRKNKTDIFKPDAADGTYSNLYFGEKILVDKEGNPNERFALNINIPMDKTPAPNLEERMIKILRVIGNILIKIKWPSIAIGTALSAYLVWSNFSVLNFIIIDLYLVLILYEIYRLVAKSRPYGLVISRDEKLVDLAIIRFNQNKKIIATSISGYDGKFTAQINPGEYNLLTKKNGFNEDKRNISIKSARKLERLDIKLQ